MFLHVSVCPQWGGGIPACLASFQAHTQGGSWGGSGQGGLQAHTQGGLSQHALRQTPPPTATAVGSTHPTGMHSCFYFVCHTPLDALVSAWLYMQTVRSSEVYTCFWLILPDFMALLCSGNCLPHQDDNNKMVTCVTSMWFNQWIFLIIAHFGVVWRNIWLNLIEWSISNANICNRMILSPTLKLLLWSFGKVCICFCYIKKF